LRGRFVLNQCAHLRGNLRGHRDVVHRLSVLGSLAKDLTLSVGADNLVAEADLHDTGNALYGSPAAWVGART